MSCYMDAVILYKTVLCRYCENWNYYPEEGDEDNDADVWSSIMSTHILTGGVLQVQQILVKSVFWFVKHSKRP